MRRLLRYVEKLRPKPETLIEVRISGGALESNIEAFKQTYALPIAPVLKSNAYGHGLLEVARLVAPMSPPFLVVDSYFEAQFLRLKGIATPLLVIGFVPLQQILTNRLHAVSFVVTSFEALQMLANSNVRTSVHIKIDTGMHRQGILPPQVEDAFDLLQKSYLRVEGICSHFASADSDQEFTHKQIKVWNEQVSKWRQHFPRMKYWHIAASAGAAYGELCEANLIRLGAGLYGFERIPSRSLPLASALSMHSQLTVVKEIKKGDSVGYNNTFFATQTMKIATVPVGYFEGYDRRLSNKGVMLVDSVTCPVIGRVSMNMTTIDVSQCKTTLIGTRVVVISNSLEDPNSVEKLAALCDMSPLEFLVHIPQHLRRVVV